MMEKGHCADTKSADTKNSDHDKMGGGKNCCVAMCSAVALSETPSVEPYRFATSDPVSAREEFRFTFLAKLPTPPPRIS